MPKLAIRSLTRGLYSIGKGGFWVDQEYPKTLIFLKKGKNHPKRKNSKTSREMQKLAIHPLTRGL